MDLIYNSINSALEILSEKEKIILVFEDIQWADNLSVKLLINLILHLNKNTLVIMTKSNELDNQSDRMFVTLDDLNKIITVNLSRFDRSEVDLLIRRELKGKKVTDQMVDEIYKKSRGNAFFLNEYIEIYKKQKDVKSLSSKMVNILQNKFSSLNNEEMRILEILSVFYGAVSIENLLNVIDMKLFEVIKNIDTLIKMNILEEIVVDNKALIKFSYIAYKDYLYDSLNDCTKQIINREIALSLQKELKINSKDISGYIKLKYYFTRAGEKVTALKYEVFILNYYLSFSHELFPDLKDYDIGKQSKWSYS